MNFVIWFFAILGAVLILVHAVVFWRMWKSLYDDHDGMFWFAFGLVNCAISFLLRSILYPKDVMNIMSGVYTIPSLDLLSVMLIFMGFVAIPVTILPMILQLFGYYDKQLTKKLGNKKIL